MKKTVIVTGANRGLGEAFVDVLMEDPDCCIISISRRLSEAQKTYPGERFHFLEVDLSTERVGEKIAPLKAWIGHEPVYFINNASIIEPVVKVEDIAEAAIDKTLAVNVKSTMLITQYLLSHFAGNPLTFVNISSGAANRAIGHWSLYCSSKAFIQMFFQVAEREYGQHRFFNIDPGVMDTGMQQHLRERDFPDVENFRALETKGQLKSPMDVARDILKTIIK